MRRAGAPTFLAIAAAVWLLVDFYFLYQRLTEGWGYYREHPYELTASTLLLLMPLALLVHGLGLAAAPAVQPSARGAVAAGGWPGDPEAPPPPPLPSESVGVEMPYGRDDWRRTVAAAPTVGSWLATFFIASLPLIGLIALIVWTGDRSNPARRTWAIACFVWALIVLVVSGLAWFVVLQGAR